MSYLQEVLEASPSQAYALFKEQLKHVGEVQAATLLDIVRLNEDTAFGKAHDFASIHTVEEFREKVPITEFEDYEEAIEAMKEGAEDVLFAGPTTQFIVTSGTTGEPKFVPQNPSTSQLSHQVSQMRHEALYEVAPAMEDAHSFIITNLSQLMSLKDGVAAGPASGVAVSQSGERSRVMPPRFLMGASGDDIYRTESIDYISLLFGLTDPDIIALGANDASYLTRIFDLLNNNIDRVLADLRDGTISVEISDELKEQSVAALGPHPERARELRAIYDEKGELKPGDVWPNFHYVVGWISGSIGRLLKDIPDFFPEGTEFFDEGYGASEGRFGIPHELGSPAGYPVIFGTFFEFLPRDGGEPVLLSEVEDGALYELVITTYAGLYRYNLHDLVRTTINSEGIPEIEFIGKTKDRAEVAGVTITGPEVIELVEEYEEDNDVFLTHVEGEVVEDALVLHVEPHDGKLDVDDFQRAMGEKLQERGIALGGVELLPQGYRDAQRKKKVEDNLNRSQIKFLVFGSK